MKCFSRKKEMEESRYTFFSKIYPKYYHFNNGIVDFPKSLHLMRNLFPQDEFDEKTGIAVAYARLFNKEIPEYI